MPCQDMHTSAFVQEITKVGDELGIVPVIIRGEELNQRGFGGKFVVIEEVVLSVNLTQTYTVLNFLILITLHSLHMYADFCLKACYK